MISTITDGIFLLFFILNCTQVSGFSNDLVHGVIESVPDPMPSGTFF
jgi:hypothetical protein